MLRLANQNKPKTLTMKTLFTIILAGFLTLMANSQTPQKMSYQAVVRNISGELVKNSPVGMKISIVLGSATGTLTYSENQTQTTNVNGLVTLEIGSGTVTFGTFSGINWSSGIYFIKTEIDPTGGTSYTITATSQILSVPYALHAKTAESLSTAITETDPIYNASASKNITANNITNWNAAFGWGNHSGLYRPLSYVPAWIEITSNPFSFASSSNNQLIKYNSTSGKWENWTPTYLTSFTETDPIFIGWNKSTGITISSSQISDFQSSVTSNSAVLANTAKISYPSSDATKLAGIAIGAEVNVNADWNAVSGDAQIVNKPSLSTVATTGNFSDLLNKPTTLVGYGITDAVKTSGDQTIAGNKSFSGTTTVATPVNPTDAANKAYVDALIAQIEELQLQTGIKVKDVDGNIYNTVNIGTQSWMKENLKTTKYNDGTVIPNVTADATWSTLTTGAYSDYNNNPANSTTYGRLYNWFTVDNNPATKVTSNGGKNVCPTGWHIPTDVEWTTLTDYLTNNGYGFGGSGNDIAKSMASTSGWTTDPTIGNVGNDQASNNSSGFTGLPSGYRNFDVSFSYINANGIWWSTTEFSASDGYDRYIFNNTAIVYRNSGNKHYGYPVRCLKD